jgi:dTDP-glucose 4,6-dehydratase
MASLFRTILVTGGAGFIGSCFVRQAVAQGTRVIVLDALTYAGHRENLRGIPPLTDAQDAQGGFHLVAGDIADGELVAKLFKDYAFDAVVHFAAESHVDNSILGPAAFIQTNIVGTYTLLEAARNYWGSLTADRKPKFRFVQVSTDEVYGSLGAQGKFSEVSPIRPNSPYSASKAAGDHLARAWFKTYGLPTVITNCTNNYGPRQHPEKLIPHMITRALSGESLPVYGDGRNVRDWIHVEDHCAGVMLALNKGKPGEVYCFGGGAEMANIELVQSLCRILTELKPNEKGKDYASLIAYVPDRPGHDRRYAMDDSKARRELGYAPAKEFESGLRETVEWYLANAEWCEAVKKKAA